MSLFRSLGRKAERVKRSVTGEDDRECPACGATVEDVLEAREETG